MYQFLIDDETTKKAKQVAENSTNLFDEFDKVDKKYVFGEQIDKTLSLNKKEFKPLSESEIKEKATNNLNDFKKQSLSQIENDYHDKNKQLNSQINLANEQTEQQSKVIKNAYEQVKEDAKDDAIKRGLARSSIIVNKLENFDNEMLANLNDLNKNANAKIFELNKEITSLENEKQKALNDFNIEYAIKLQSEIDKINSDLEKSKNEVLEYNNKISEIQAEFEKKLAKENYDRQIDMSKFYATKGAFVVDMLKRNEKFELAKDYFSKMNKEYALAELQNNPKYKENLGDVNYEKLLERIKGNVE